MLVCGGHAGMVCWCVVGGQGWYVGVWWAGRDGMLVCGGHAGMMENVYTISEGVHVVWWSNVCMVYVF